MPVLFRTLPKEELGAWLLLGQSWAILGVLDFGFGVTLTRRIAFAKGKSGSDPKEALSEATRTEIADLVATGLRIYRLLAIIAFFIAFGLGFLYLRSLTLEAVSLGSVWTAWGILCLSQALTVWATPWTCLLQGVGYVGWDAILASFVNTLTLTGQIIVALLDGGMVGLAIVAACGALLQRIVILGFARRKRSELFRFHGRWQGNTFREMVPLAGRAWLTAIGMILVLNTDQFFIAKLQGAEKLPAYRAAYIILLNFNMLAVAMSAASSVFIAHLWQTGNIAEIQRIVNRNLRFGLFIMAAGGGCILGLGDAFFNLWLGPGNFVGYPILVVFSLLLLFEAQCYITTTASRATEDEAFAGWAVGAGLLKLVLSLCLGRSFGLLGIATATLVAQLVTNHWFMLFRGLRRLRIRFRVYTLNVLLPVSGLLFSTTLLVWLLRSVIANDPPWRVVLAGLFTSVLLFSAFLLRFVVEPSQWQVCRRWLNRNISKVFASL